MLVVDRGAIDFSAGGRQMHPMPFDADSGGAEVRRVTIGRSAIHRPSFLMRALSAGSCSKNFSTYSPHALHSVRLIAFWGFYDVLRC